MAHGVDAIHIPKLANALVLLWRRVEGTRPAARPRRSREDLDGHTQIIEPPPDRAKPGTCAEIASRKENEDIPSSQSGKKHVRPLFPIREGGIEIQPFDLRKSEVLRGPTVAISDAHCVAMRQIYQRVNLTAMFFNSTVYNC